MTEQRVVLDSYSLLAFFENERGATTIAQLLKSARDKERPLFLSVINWGEIYYILVRKVGKPQAQEVMRQIDTLPIEIVDPNRELTLIAAELKASRKMSYADCFAAALSLHHKAALVTGDKEFKEVEKEIKILWI